jgi:WD40 repeat protein
MSTSAARQSGGTSAPPEFDLFVVHAEADRAWVDGYLKPMLGLEPARVFTPRNFRLGEGIAAEFERGVTSSRFTLLVLSPAFLADRWAEFGEGLVAFSSVDEGRNRLLALTLHPCQAPLRLRFRESLDCTDWTRWDDEADRLRRHLEAPEPTIEAVSCPYPGMVPFRKEDARFFHGRDGEIQNLLTLVRQHHFLAVIGSSGSGKSSLITAGLLPRLDDPRNFPRGTWRVLSFRPGTTPVEDLARILGGPPGDPAAAVARSLAAEPPAQRLLLIVDQFEELFSQVKESTTRDSFIGHLKALRADPRCTVILTMRADFYGDLMNSPFWPIDKSQLVEVAALRGESLRQAIVKPAEAVGVYLEDGLVERLLADAAGEPGLLPMLQEALVLLWGTMSGRLLTRASYDALGHDGRSGLAVAMATKADATLAALPPDQQRIARRIFLRLVQFGEGRPDTRRQLGVNDLRAESDDPGAFDDLLQHLIANRLLTPSTDEVRGQRVDIAHEMLIIGWPASRDWVESRREAEKTRRRLVAKAEEWVRLGRAESGLLDPAELVEADTWLSGPDAAELGVDSDVQALAVASRRAIESLKRRKRMWTRVAIGGLTAALVAISGFAYWGELKREAAEKSDSEAKAKATEAVLARKQAEKSADEARANAADALIGAGSTALANGHSFDAMHRFALAIKTLPDHSPLRGVMSPSLGLLAREVPRIESILEHTGSVNSAGFSPDGARVVTASVDRTSRVWTAADGTLRVELKGHADSVHSAVFSPDGARVVTASFDRTARVWNAADGTLRAVLKGHAVPLFSAAFSPDGARVVTASGDRTARVWDAADGTLRAVLKGHADRVHSPVFSPDGARVVTASNDGTARVWNAADGTLRAVLKGHTNVVQSAAFSPDGAQVVTASVDQTARVWNAADGSLRVELKGHAVPLFSAAFSPDGAGVVTASVDQTARVWNAADGTLRAVLKGHPRSVTSAAFSPDGARVVTASFDRTARVWNAADGTLLAVLKGHAHVVTSAAFSPDGTRVVTASGDPTARVWKFEAVPGDASILPLWIEVLTGTEMKGSVVQPLAPIEWKKRKEQIQARDKEGVLAKWFEKPNATIKISTGPVKK